MRHFGEWFGSAAGTADDYGAKAEDASPHWFFDGDAFDFLEENFEGATGKNTLLDEDALVGDGHFGGVAFRQADDKNENSDDDYSPANFFHVIGVSGGVVVDHPATEADEKQCWNDDRPEKYDPVK